MLLEASVACLALTHLLCLYYFSFGFLVQLSPHASSEYAVSNCFYSNCEDFENSLSFDYLPGCRRIAQSRCPAAWLPEILMPGLSVGGTGAGSDLIGCFAVNCSTSLRNCCGDWPTSWCVSFQ